MVDGAAGAPPCGARGFCVPCLRMAGTQVHALERSGSTRFGAQRLWRRTGSLRPTGSFIERERAAARTDRLCGREKAKAHRLPHPSMGCATDMVRYVKSVTLYGGMRRHYIHSGSEQHFLIADDRSWRHRYPRKQVRPLPSIKAIED
jgi:hypothetical protein